MLQTRSRSTSSRIAVKGRTRASSAGRMIDSRVGRSVGRSDITGTNTPGIGERPTGLGSVLRPAAPEDLEPDLTSDKAQVGRGLGHASYGLRVKNRVSPTSQSAGVRLQNTMPPRLKNSSCGACQGSFNDQI